MLAAGADAHDFPRSPLHSLAIAPRLRIDDEDNGGALPNVGGGAPTNALRGKIVRPDFIQGIEEHWMGMEIVRNDVRPDLWCEGESGDLEPVDVE